MDLQWEETARAKNGTYFVNGERIDGPNPTGKKVAYYYMKHHHSAVYLYGDGTTDEVPVQPDTPLVRLLNRQHSTEVFITSNNDWIGYDLWMWPHSTRMGSSALKLVARREVELMAPERSPKRSRTRPVSSSLVAFAQEAEKGLRWSLTR